MNKCERLVGQETLNSIKNKTNGSNTTKCDCYFEQEAYNPYSYLSRTIGRCNGTKERDECHCGGDRTKCDFYPEVQEKVNSQNTDKKGHLYDVYIKTLKGGIEHYIAKSSNVKFYNGIARIEDESGKIIICSVDKMQAYSK